MECYICKEKIYLSPPKAESFGTTPIYENGRIMDEKMWHSKCELGDEEEVKI